MEYRTKEEQVADFLREGIISGRFPRGTRVKQVEIAQLLKISVTPVREAIKLLVAEGYLSGSSYKGATVVPFDVSASREIINLRMLLEAELVRFAVERLAPADVDELKALAAEFEAGGRQPGQRHGAGGELPVPQADLYDRRPAADVPFRPDPVGPLSVRRHQPDRGTRGAGGGGACGSCCSR